MYASEQYVRQAVEARRATHQNAGGPNGAAGEDVSAGDAVDQFDPLPLARWYRMKTDPCNYWAPYR